MEEFATEKASGEKRMGIFSRLIIGSAMLAMVPSAFLSPPAAQAESVRDFYKGKTVRVIIGTPVAGSYGIYAQLTARHLGRFIPGSPTVIMQSMMGAGGLVALNHLGQQAPRDGTVLSVIHSPIVQDGLFNPQAKINPTEFQWIGRIASIEFLGVASNRSGIKTLEDARKREVLSGAPGLNNVLAQAPQVLNRMAGTKFRIISGYKGTDDTFLAVERGEIEMGAATVATLRAYHWAKVERGELVPIYAHASSRLKDFPDVPILLEFGKTEVEKTFLRVFTSPAEIGRALATPPAVPADRIEALRTAFDRMIADPEFRAEAAKANVPLEPKSGAEMQQLVRTAATMSPETHKQVREFYNELLKR
jgi:tripartite-type tricarboxylate transporter receptor subunit TctC